MMSIKKQMFSTTCPNRRISSSTSETRLVLLGKTGSGKSSTANSILGRKVFDTKVSSSSITQRCRRACGEFRGRHLTVLDTPGLLDTHQTPQEVHRELKRSISLIYPGPHAFLLVIQIGRFTQEEKEVIQQIKKAMGSHALSFSVIVFTHGDALEEGASVKQWLIDECSDLAELVAACGGRYSVFNNNNSKNKEQVCELLAKVDNIMQDNGGRSYTIQMLQKAEENMSRQHKERRLVSEKVEMLIKIQQAKIKVLYERELEMLLQKNKEIEDLKKKQEMERQMEKVARKREEAFLLGTQEKDKERKICEMLRLMEMQREGEKTEELIEELDSLARIVGDQIGWDGEMRRTMEEKIQRDQMENERKDREKDIQQKQREQVIGQTEQINRDTFQKELDKLTQTLEEQSRKEEEWKKQMEDLLRWQREKNKRDWDIQMENQKTNQQRTDVLQQELKVIKMKIEQQVSEEKHKRQEEESLQKGREQSNMEIQTVKNECDVTMEKMSVKKHSTISTVIGYVQEIWLMGLNAALERVRTPCCIQ